MIRKLVITLTLSVSVHFLSAQWDQFRNLDFNETAADSLSGLAYWQTPDFVTASAALTGDGNHNTCLQISGGYEADRPGYVYQHYPVRVADYTKLRISARLKPEAIKDGKGAIYAYTKRGEQWLQYQNLADEQAVAGSGDWREVSVEIWVGPDAETLRIGASLDGSGKLLVDDFQVQLLEKPACEPTAEQWSFMRECMTLIGRHSLYREEFDTVQLMENWKILAGCSEGMKGVYDGLTMILRSIDNHSFYWPAEQVEKWQNTSSDPQADVPFSKGHHIDEEYAYLWMPYLGSGDSVTQVRFADQLHALIDSLDRTGLRGWVLDLRDNQGGNCWPMLAGIGPILGEGICGYFQEGENWQSWSYRSGASYLLEKKLTEVSGKPYKPYRENPPVAVLTGPRTSSSGEIVAVAFKNRPGSKLFGQHSGGYTTGNQNHTLSDGSMLFLAQSVYADRDRTIYSHGVAPDVEVLPAGQADSTLARALEWLRGIER